MFIGRQDFNLVHVAGSVFYIFWQCPLLLAHVNTSHHIKIVVNFAFGTDHLVYIFGTVKKYSNKVRKRNIYKLFIIFSNNIHLISFWLCLCSYFYQLFSDYALCRRFLNAFLMELTSSNSEICLNWKYLTLDNTVDLYGPDLNITSTDMSKKTAPITNSHSCKTTYNIWHIYYKMKIEHPIIPMITEPLSYSTV